MSRGTWWDRKIKYVKTYNGLFRRSQFVSMMYQSKKQHELEMDKLRERLKDLSDKLYKKSKGHKQNE